MQSDRISALARDIESYNSLEEMRTKRFEEDEDEKTHKLKMMGFFLLKDAVWFFHNFVRLNEDEMAIAMMIACRRAFIDQDKSFLNVVGRIAVDDWPVIMSARHEIFVNLAIYNQLSLMELMVEEELIDMTHLNTLLKRALIAVSKKGTGVIATKIIERLTESDLIDCYLQLIRQTSTHVSFPVFHGKIPDEIYYNPSVMMNK